MSSGTAQRLPAAQGMVSAAVCVSVLMRVMATWLFQKFDLREISEIIPILSQIDFGGAKPV